MKDTAHELKIISEQYYDEIYKYCRRRVRNDDIAYDLTQDVFVALSESIASIEKTGIRKWLYSTAGHKIADYYREIEKIKAYLTDTPLDNLDTDPDALVYDPFAEMNPAEIEKTAQKILEDLLPADKALYYERYVLKLGYKELSQKYAVSETNMRKRVSRLHGKITKIVHNIFSMIIFYIF